MTHEQMLEALIIRMRNRATMARLKAENYRLTGERELSEKNWLLGDTLDVVVDCIEDTMEEMA